MNNFALYTSTAQFSHLEKARTAIDGAYKSKKDSFNYKNNLIRSLVYSSLAFADSTRKLKYVKDPIEETKFSFRRLKSPKLNDENKPELDFINNQLAKAYLVRANKASASEKYADAYSAYLSVDSLDKTNYLVKHNLAILSERLGSSNRAIYYYEQLIADKKRSLPAYYLALSNLYDFKNSNRSLEVLREGRRLFPGNKDLLFKEINIYVENGSYNEVERIVADALQLDSDNVSLNYLAGFSYEAMGKKEKAIEYYQKVITLEPNNYEGNYALGLFYLNSYIRPNNKQESSLSLAKKYLTIAGEINPNSVNVLKSLAVLYNNTGDMVELERVNEKLKQFILTN
ncbi:MAG: tetratricopeptide repeat protein [Arcticibacter sp.]